MLNEFKKSLRPKEKPNKIIDVDTYEKDVKFTEKVEGKKQNDYSVMEDGIKDIAKEYTEEL